MCFREVEALAPPSYRCRTTSRTQHQSVFYTYPTGIVYIVHMWRVWACVIIHNMTFTCCIHNYSGTSNYGASDEGPTSLQTVCPLPIILPIHLFTFKEGTEKQDKTHFIKDLKRFHCTLYVVRVSLNFSHLHKCTKSDSYKTLCTEEKREHKVSLCSSGSRYLWLQHIHSPHRSKVSLVRLMFLQHTSSSKSDKAYMITTKATLVWQKATHANGYKFSSYRWQL